MSSAKQIAANRKNAQKSKGPRTAAGKAHASCNSRKHALTTISRNHPLFAQRIEAIARAICPNTTNAGLWEQALIIGECTTVLACVQAERIALMDQAFWQNEPKIPQSGIRWANAAAAERKPELGAAELVPPRDELDATELAARDLDRLERYQRRALSRRKRAIETFMAMSNTLQSPPSEERPSLDRPPQRASPAQGVAPEHRRPARRMAPSILFRAAADNSRLLKSSIAPAHWPVRLVRSGRRLGFFRRQSTMGTIRNQRLTRKNGPAQVKNAPG